MTTTESVGVLVWWLAHGECISNRDAARLTGMPIETARQMMERLCRVLPLTFDDGVWFVICMDESMQT